MINKKILIVDDEKNIRLTMTQCLQSMNMEVLTAVNGEEALSIMNEETFALVFLDLKLPGISGMETLDKIRIAWPDTKIIIITAHGSVESAVDCMKKGAVDFLRKPFSPAEVRELVDKTLRVSGSSEDNIKDYESFLKLARELINAGEYAQAETTINRAIALTPATPGAYNLFGVLCEVKGDNLEAQKYFRAALEFDPTHEAARANLERAVGWQALRDKEPKNPLLPEM